MKYLWRLFALVFWGCAWVFVEILPYLERNFDDAAKWVEERF